MTVSRTGKYIAGVSTGYLTTVAGIIVSLALTPFILRYLDAEAYGIFTLGTNVIMFLTLIDIGVAAGINVHLAQNIGRIDAEEISRYASSGFFFQLLIVFMVIMGGLVLSILFPTFFEVPENLTVEATWMVLILASSVALSLAVQPFSSILIAHQLVYVDNFIRLLLLFLRTAITIALISNGFGILSMAIANLTATGITAVLSVWRAYRLVNGLQISYRLISPEIIRSAGSTGIWFSIGGIAGLVIQSVDNTIAGKLVSLESVTTLAITGKVYFLSQGLLYQLTNVARPMMGQLIGQGKMDQALKAYRHLFAVSTGLAIIACATLWSINGVFVAAWVGEQHYGGTLLDLAFALNLLVNVWTMPNRATLSAGLIVRPQVVMRVLEAILNLGLSLLLTMRFGLIGVVISTAMVAMVTSLFYLPYLTAHMFERSFRRFLLDDAIPVLRLLVIIFPSAYVVRMLTQTLGGFEGVLIGVVGVGGLGVFLWWFMVFDDDLRAYISKLLMSQLSRFGVVKKVQ